MTPPRNALAQAQRKGDYAEGGPSSPTARSPDLGKEARGRREPGEAAAHARGLRRSPPTITSRRSSRDGRAFPSTSMLAKASARNFCKMEEEIEAAGRGAAARRSPRSRPRSGARAPDCRTPTGRSARSCFLAPPGVGKTELTKALASFPVRRRERSWCGSTCRNIWRNTRSPG